MSRAIAFVVAVVCLSLPAGLVNSWTQSAEVRLEQAEREAAEEEQEVAIAANANEDYCTPHLKKILRRVAQSCGLINSGAGRGCQPADAKNLATMSGEDFNALFMPMRERGGIVQYEKASAELDQPDRKMVDGLFADRRGASYFFVVSRASPEGSAESNRELSRGRAEAVLEHLKTTFNDPDLDRQVGLLWLGEEYAQLDPSFCEWKRSGELTQCAVEDLNRSAFITWIDCTL